MKELISQREIEARVRELAQEISKDLQNKEVAVVGVLKGAFVFMSDLVRQLDLPVHCDFVRVSSYKGDQTSGSVHLDLDLSQSIKDKHVLLVEDLIDTGTTLSFLLDHLSTKEPASIQVCALLYKDVNPKIRDSVDYVGFNIGNEFVIGYGMDFNGLYRSLPYIAVLPPSANYP